MKNILLWTILFSVCLLKAQNNYEDVVYLKNGSVIHGIIIEQIPNESIKIKSGQNTFVFKISEVQKMTKEEVAASSNNNNGASIQTVTYDAKGMETYLKKKLETESAGNLQFVDFKKTDGFATVVNAQNRYTLYFTFTFQPVTDVWKSGNSGIVAVGHLWSNFNVYKEKLTGWDEQLAMGQKQYKTNQPIRLTGRSELFKTETGWKIEALSFNKEELLSSTEVNQINNEQITKVNAEINNNAGNYAYQPIDKMSFTINNLPVLQNASIELSKIEASNSNFDITEIQNIITTVFRNNNRLEQNTTSKSTNVFEYEFTINNISYSFDQGKKLFSNEPYSGYNCVLSLNYKITNKTTNTLVYKEPITITGGDPKLNYNKDNAHKQCLELLKKTLNSLILYYNPIQCDFISVTSENKKGMPKTISLSNANYFEKNSNVQFALVEEKDIYYAIGSGELKYTNVIATGEFDKKEDGNIICKIKSGEENLKTYIDGNKKFIAVTSIKKLEKVD